MTLKEYRKNLKVSFEFLTNSKHRKLIFGIWAVTFIFIIILPKEIMISDNLMNRILLDVMVFFLFYTLLYLVIYMISKKTAIDIDALLSSKVLYLIYFVVFIFILFFLEQIITYIIVVFIIIILIETVFFLDIPSNLVIKTLEKRNKSISHPRYYILFIIFVISPVLILLLQLRFILPDLDFGVYQLSFIFFIVGSYIVIFTITVLLIIDNVRKSNPQHKHVKMILILIISIVAFVMFGYYALINILDNEVNVWLNSISIGLSIFKDLLLIGIVFSIELNQVGDIKDKQDSNKTYLFILMIQTVMLFEKRIIRSMIENNPSPIGFPNILILITVIIAIPLTFCKLNKKYKKNPNALLGQLKLSEQKRHRILVFIIIFVILIFFSYIFQLILLAIQK